MPGSDPASNAYAKGLATGEVGDVMDPNYESRAKGVDHREKAGLAADAAGVLALPAKALGWFRGLLGASSAEAAAAASTGAESAAAAANLSKHLKYLQDYGQAGFKTLESGRIRYYGEMTAARTQGEMAGARLVREWDPATGATRTWYETLDHVGRVRSVAPKPVTEPLNHRIFDADGNYTGRR